MRDSQYRHDGRKFFTPALYHIRAWGSERHPDLNYDTSNIPDRLYRIYPFIDITRLDAVPLAAIKNALAIKDALHGQEAPR